MGYELIGQKWSKDKKNAPNITFMISRFNSCSSWVVSVLVYAPDVKERNKRASHLMSILAELIKINNFNASTWMGE